MHTSTDRNTSHNPLPIHTQTHTYQSFTERPTTTTKKRHPLLLSHTQRLTDPWCATKFIFPPQIDTLIYSISLCGCLNLDLGWRGQGGSKWSHFMALSCFNNGPVISARRPYCVGYAAQSASWRWRKHQDGLHGCWRVRPQRGVTCLWKGIELNIQTCEYGRWLAAAEAATRGVQTRGGRSVVMTPTWMWTVGGKWMAWQGTNARLEMKFKWNAESHSCFYERMGGTRKKNTFTAITQRFNVTYLHLS